MKLLIVLIIFLIAFQYQKSELLNSEMKGSQKAKMSLKIGGNMLNQNFQLQNTKRQKIKRYNTYYYRDFSKSILQSNDCKVWFVQNALLPLDVITKFDSEKSIETLKLSPLPADDYITINLKTTEVTKLDIYNGMGILIQSEILHPMISNHKIDIDHLSAGIYFIRIGERIEKFVKI